MLWAPEGEKSQIHPFPIVRDKKIVLDKPNAFEGSKMMYEEVFFLSVPLETEHFDAFWHFLSI